MSRLIIKNLPNAITSEKLKERFATKGVVTDIQLKYTQNGKFRHFGFIGFQTKEEADRAVEYFNNTYINQSKISIEHCADLGDASKPKAWSKYAPDSSAFKKLHSKKEKVERKLEDGTDPKEKEITKKKEKINPDIVEKIKKHKNDPMFLEFMETHSKEDALKIISEANDSGVEEEGNEEEKENSTNKTEDSKTAFSNISDLEYLKLKQKSVGKVEEKVTERSSGKSDIKETDEDKDNLFTVKITNLAFSTKKKEVKDFLRPLKPVGIRLPRKVSGFAYVTFKTAKEMKKALNKNKSFLKGKQVSVKQYVSHEEKEGNHSKVGNEKQRWKEQEEAIMHEESIAESGSIFVRNLAYTITEENLTQLFSPFGPLADVTLPVDKESRCVKGFATVTFVMPEHAVAAYSALDGTVFIGRMLHLLPAKTKKPVEEENENKSFNDKKKEKEKSSAGQSHNWNTLFLGQNAIVDVMAEKYKTSKLDVLTGSDVAVRVALGETQIVSETRQFLLHNGVSLDAFNQAPKLRSKTVILVKNLPAKTTAAEIRDLFCKFGEIGRIVLPPIGVTAIVEFLEASEAKKAFLNLAYTRFKHLPLFLEWAPEDTFSPAPVKEKTEEDGDIGIKQEEVKMEEESKEDDMEPEPDTTMYIKNLNFETKEESIKKHFSKCGKVASVTIARKKDPSRPGQMLSMGYGFVQFYRQAELSQALKQLQHSMLDGHKLELKRSNRTLQDNSNVSRKKNNVEKQTGTKILVRNIPFQATQKEVHQLFETFGKIKSLRLPKKMVGTGSHRGFAFVEFHTKHDAKRAMQALCQSTHFFGRRLVLEWAQQDEDIEQLRKRTAASFKQGSEPRSKKARADLEIEDEEEDE